MQITNEIQKAYEIAKKTRENAHAPYSNFKVGACVKIKGLEEYVGGCNVENASYGGTICAERNAIWASVAKYGKPEFDFLVLITHTESLDIPCAFCLQVMAEFVKPEFPIYLANLKGVQKKMLFKDFLPHTFTSFVSETKV